MTTSTVNAQPLVEFNRSAQLPSAEARSRSLQSPTALRDSHLAHDYHRLPKQCKHCKQIGLHTKIRARFPRKSLLFRALTLYYFPYVLPVSGSSR